MIPNMAMPSEPFLEYRKLRRTKRPLVMGSFAGFIGFYWISRFLCLFTCKAVLEVDQDAASMHESQLELSGARAPHA